LPQLTRADPLPFRHPAPPPGAGVKVKPVGCYRNLDAAGRGRMMVGGFGLRNKTRFSEGRFLIAQPYSSAHAQALVRANSSGSPGGKISS